MAHLESWQAVSHQVSAFSGQLVGRLVADS